MGRRQGRGRLTAFDRLPKGIDEVDEVVAWAAQELAARTLTQVQIYAEFSKRLTTIREALGLKFRIPSKSSFNRYSLRRDAFTRRLEMTREIAASISDRFDAEASDDLTLIAAEAIKTLVFELLETRGEAGLDPKGAMQLANALRSVASAQSVSTARRQKVLAEFNDQAEEAIKTVAKEAGLSADVVSQLRREFLGVRETEAKQ